MGDLNGAFAPQHDIVWYGCKGRPGFPNTRPVSVLRAMRLPGEALMHPNEKPVALMVQIIEAATHQHYAILDPFAGSGTTGVACAKTGRKFIGIEIEEKYCEIAAKRLSQDVFDLRENK
jgi:site-specific DNA-methyltransferase (adenine-specific)